MNIDIELIDKEITPWGGMIFLRQMLEKLNFKDQVAGCIDLPVPGSNCGYSPQSIIEAFIVSIWCGANRFQHTEIMRQDKAVADIFEWKRVPSQDTIKRFFLKFNQAKNQRVSNYFYSWIFDNTHFDNYTIDCDSSVLTRYGQQEGAKKGYNSHKPGRPSHHPIIAFIADLRLVANFWLRSGNSTSSESFVSFLEDTLQKLGARKAALLRLDSGFYSNDVLTFLEQKSLNHIIAAKFYEPVQRMIASEQCWILVSKGIEVSETMYKSQSWDKPRRMIIVRQELQKRPNAPGKELRLFEDDEIYQNYRYTAYVTNMTLSAVDIWRLYRGRGDAENRIKELKYDFGFDSFNMRDFFGTEAALIFTMLAYNLMSLFRKFIINSKTQQRLSTLRYKIFSIGAYFDKDGDRYILKLALSYKRREWFSGLWYNSKHFSLPFGFSIA